MSKTHLRAMAVLCAALSGVLGCKGDEPAAGGPVPPAQVELPPAAAALAPSTPAAISPVEPAANGGKSASGPSRVHFALARHVARAEARRGAAQLIDFGVAGDEKHTLAGWLTFAGDGRTFAGTRAMFVRGQNVKIALPADSASHRRLTLRLRSFRRAPLTVYVNGKTVADRALAGSDFETFVLPLDEGVLVAGENLLELRAPTGGDTPSSGFALDYIELAPEAAPEASPPPSPSELSSGETLHVPSGVRLGYTFEVPAGATLGGSLRADAKATLHVTALRDGKPPLDLGAHEAGAEAKPLRIDLSALAGELARIDLSAEGSVVHLDDAAVRVPAPAPPPSAAAKPIKNVIVLLIDTLRADKLSPYNDKTRVRTPSLSRFLRTASVMLDARTQENWTKPSVATLLSSLYPWEHSAYTGDAVLPSGVDVLPEQLRKHGYFTGAFIANGYVSDKFGFKQGLDTYRNYVREGRRNVAQYVAADVLEWLDERPKDKPFFLYVHTIDPHVPYIPPPSFLSLYDPLPYEGPVDFRRKNDLLEQVKIGRQKLDERDKERLVALYDGEISYHDVHFGAIFDGLDKRGLADDTMVVVTADHGEEFWDHGSVGHGHSIYDELLHVPLMVRVPGVTEGSPKVRADVGLVDVAPTIFEALGLPTPKGLSGTSFLPELRGDGADAPRATVSGFMTAWRTLAVGSWKLVQHGVERMSLYDVRRDPGETTDLAKERPLALRYARALLGLTLADRMQGTQKSEAATRVHEQQKTRIDSETEAQLRALGYVGSSRR